MDLQEPITNEKIAKRFGSQFELVNYAIRLASHVIRTGREPRVRTDNQNKALQALAEIVHDVDHIDEALEQAHIINSNAMAMQDLPPRREREHREREKETRDLEDFDDALKMRKKSKRELMH